MESAFFRDVGHLNIHNGNFVMDNSQKTTTHRHATTINDRSRHTTNYGGYTNYGQHADGNGTINNIGALPETAYGSRQYPVSGPNNFNNLGMNNRTPPSSDDDYFNDYVQPPARGQNHPYRQPDRVSPGGRNYSRRYPTMQSGPRFGNNETGLPRAEMERPNHPRQDFDHTSPQFRSEYDTMSPQMKKYLRNLGFNHDPADSLNADMANVSLDDPVLQRSHSPGSYGSRTPDNARKGKNVAHHPSYDSDEDQFDESDQESTNDNLHQYSSSYTHNDNRVITKNINSHNTNTENVVDSYNDNSTRTDIKKAR